MLTVLNNIIGKLLISDVRAIPHAMDNV